MEMAFCFLGTGAGDCVEMRHEAGRKDTDARKSGEKDTRHSPGLFVPPDILVDRFSPERLRACCIQEECIRHLLISHGHQDHFQPRAILNLAARRPWGLTVYGSMTVRNALDFASRYTGSLRLYMRTRTLAIAISPRFPKEKWNYGLT